MNILAMTPPAPKKARHHDALVIKHTSHREIHQVFLMERSREEDVEVFSYLVMDEDPKTYSEAISSQDVSLWKEEI